MMDRKLILFFLGILFVFSICANIAYYLQHKEAEKKFSKLETATDSLISTCERLLKLVDDSSGGQFVYYELDGKKYSQKQIIDSAFIWRANSEAYINIFGKYKDLYNKEIDNYNNSTVIKLDSLSALQGLLKYLSEKGIDASVGIDYKNNESIHSFDLGEKTGLMVHLYKLYQQGKLNVEFKDSFAIIHPFNKTKN